MMKRSATAIWKGSGKEGKGIITTASYALDKAYFTWNSRFEEKRGTNPEELLAAAHAGCFSMKLGFLLEEAGYHPELIETTVEITMDNEITNSHLFVKAKIHGITNWKFEELTNRAKFECPVSKALSITITMEMSLISEEVIYDL